MEQDIQKFMHDHSLGVLPPSLAQQLLGKEFTAETIGLSGASVFSFSDAVLKIEAHSPEVDCSAAVTQWMEQRLPVPKVLHYEVFEGKSYLLMSRISGEMSCSPWYMEHSREAVRLLAEGLKMLWAADPTGCPVEHTIEDDLARARRNVAEGRIDREDLTRNAPEFDSPEALLLWLEAHKPDYDPVVSHGDYCMPNVLLKDGQVSGLIDLAHAGIADRYSDINDCFWSLGANFGGFFGGKVYPDFDPDTLFNALGIVPDWEKLKFYDLLGKLLG